ncbi:hypothetical protein FHG87_004432 [Trinorchestia longiramus]|nr:hypothetical protein FHG87_004432 [Trinorchestia longiramus]
MSTHNRDVKPSEEEDDPVEKMLKKAGCLEQHYSVQLCMAENKDWRKCQEVVKEFQTCIETDKKRRQGK